MRTSAAAFLIGLGITTGAMAQDAGAPMSAIPWLSDSVDTPQGVPGTSAGLPLVDEPAVTAGGTVAAVTVTPLGGTRPDAIGILAPSVTGLPQDLWGQSRPEDIARRFREMPAETLPAIQALTYKLLLAELDPPVMETAANGAVIFLARIDKLLDLGALDQAEALLERAGPDIPEVFRRWFDVTLLIGEEDKLCDVLSGSPALSPTYQARIFCLARMGDWDSAALLLGTGSALGLIADADADLFARFLDPDLFEGEPPLPQPDQPTPLTFRMFEAIGQSIPTTSLPVAFAQADLRANIGWKARIEAGERLARTGAVTDNQLLGLYTERRAAASGGVWTRVEALQKLEAALGANDPAAIAEALLPLWEALSAARVEVAIAHVHGGELAGLGLPGEAGRIAFRMGLLSPDYEAVAQAPLPEAADTLDEVMAAVARGQVAGLRSSDARVQAVIDGFTAEGPPARLADLIQTDRLGEAILRAMALFSDGTQGDLDQVTDALALFRAVGLEATARRAALEYLILDRHG